MCFSFTNIFVNTRYLIQHYFYLLSTALEVTNNKDTTEFTFTSLLFIITVKNCYSIQNPYYFFEKGEI